MIPESAARAAEDAYRETLLELRLAEGGGFKVASQVKRSISAALEAAASHMHRTIVTAEQLDNLPVGSVILGYDDDLDQLVSRKSVDECWEQAGTDDGWQAAGIIQWYGSVIVLHEPAA